MKERREIYNFKEEDLRFEGSISKRKIKD